MPIGAGVAKPLAHSNEFDPASRLASHGRDLERLKRRSSGEWHVVGDSDDDDAVPYKNGWGPPTGALQPMRFRHLLGGGVELQGSCAGGTVGTVMFTLPVGYRPDKTLRPVGSDDDGLPIVLEIKASGDVSRLS